MEGDDLDFLFSNIPDYDFDENERVKYEPTQSPTEEPDLYAYELYHSEHIVRPPSMASKNGKMMFKLQQYLKDIMEMTKMLQLCVKQITRLRVFEASRTSDNNVTLCIKRVCNGTRFTVQADPEFFEGLFTVVIRFQTYKPRLLMVQHTITFDNNGTAKFFFKDIPEDAKVTSADLCVCSIVNENLYDKMFKLYTKLKKKHNEQHVDDLKPPQPKRRRIKLLNIYDALSELCIDQNEVGTSPEKWSYLLGNQQQPSNEIEDVAQDNEMIIDELENVVNESLPSDLKYKKQFQVLPISDSDSSSVESDEDDVVNENFGFQPVVFDPTKLFESDVSPSPKLMPIVYSVSMHILA